MEVPELPLTTQTIKLNGTQPLLITIVATLKLSEMIITIPV